MTDTMSQRDRDDLEALAQAIEARPDLCENAIMDRLEMGRRRALFLVRKYEAQLSKRLGCRVLYSAAVYVPSLGGRRGRQTRATFYVIR